MERTLDTFLASLADDKRDELTTLMKAAQKQQRRLETLYVSRKLTPAAMAKALGISGRSRAALRARDTMTVAALIDYVEALGGQVKITAVFEDVGPVPIEELFLDKPPLRRKPERDAAE